MLKSFWRVISRRQCKALSLMTNDNLSEDQRKSHIITYHTYKISCSETKIAPMQKMRKILINLLILLTVTKSEARIRGNSTGGVNHHIHRLKLNQEKARQLSNESEVDMLEAAMSTKTPSLLSSSSSNELDSFEGTSTSSSQDTRSTAFSDTRKSIKGHGSLRAKFSSSKEGNSSKSLKLISASSSSSSSSLSKSQFFRSEGTSSSHNRFSTIKSVSKPSGSRKEKPSILLEASLNAQYAVPGFEDYPYKDKSYSNDYGSDCEDPFTENCEDFGH